MPDVYRLKTSYFETISIKKSCQSHKFDLHTCGTSNNPPIFTLKKIQFFDQNPVVNPAEFRKKSQKTKFFFNLKKTYVPDVYRLKIIIFEQNIYKK